MHVCICILRAFIIPLLARTRRLCAIASAKIQSAKSHEAPESMCLCVTVCLPHRHVRAPGTCLALARGAMGLGAPIARAAAASGRHSETASSRHRHTPPSCRTLPRPSSCRPSPTLFSFMDFLQLRGSHSGRARGCDCARRCCSVLFLPETDKKGERGREREREVRPPRRPPVLHPGAAVAAGLCWRHGLQKCRKHVLHMKHALIGARTCPWALRATTSVIELRAPATNS